MFLTEESKLPLEGYFRSVPFLVTCLFVDSVCIESSVCQLCVPQNLFISPCQSRETASRIAFGCLDKKKGKDVSYGDETTTHFIPREADSIINAIQSHTHSYSASIHSDFSITYHSYTASIQLSGAFTLSFKCLAQGHFGAQRSWGSNQTEFLVNQQEFYFENL